jgi:hypothetical protein
MSAVVQDNVETRDGTGQAKVVPISADLRREYVANRVNVWSTFIEGIRALPWSLDDVTRDLGDDLYEKMALDPEIAGLLTSLKTAVLAQGIELTPPIADMQDPDYQLAEQIRDFCQRSIDRLDPTLHDTLDNMLDAIGQGNKVAEIVLEEGIGEDARKFVLRKLAVKPRRSVAFVVDMYGNVVGFLGLMPGQIPLVQAGMTVFDPEKQHMLPREKFAVLAFRAKDGDPRGTSILRPAYNVWWLKMQTWPELLKYLARFGSPSVVGFTAESAQSTLTTDGVRVTAQETMMGELVQWQNGAAAAFPFGAKVQFAEANGNGEAFRAAIQEFDRQMSKGVTGQTLATSEGQHQARAASQVHQDVLGLVVMFAKMLVAHMLVRDILRPLVAINFGADKERLAPHASLGEVAKEDIAPLLTAAAGAGYTLDPSQFAEMDAQFGMPPRDPDSIELAIARQNAPPVQAPPPNVPNAPDPSSDTQPSAKEQG